MSGQREKIAKLADIAGKVLANAVLRTVLPVGQLPIDCSPEKARELLEPFEATLISDRATLTELLKLAFFEGVRSLHTDLSNAPGVDPEMLDESVEHFTTRDGCGEAVRL